MSDAPRAEPELYDVNQRLALICVDDSDRRAEVSAAIQELGYRPQMGGDPSEAIARLRKHRYEVVVVDEAFQDSTPHDHPVLQALQWMPMASRRYILVALLAPAVTTFDSMTAFVRSVNVVINYGDLPQVRAILERAIHENDEFYRTFRQVLQEAGRR